jgi:hypothetical protein
MVNTTTHLEIECKAYKIEQRKVAAKKQTELVKSDHTWPNSTQKWGQKRADSVRHRFLASSLQDLIFSHVYGSGGVFVYLLFVDLFVCLFVYLFMDSKPHVGGGGLLVYLLFVCLFTCLWTAKPMFMVVVCLSTCLFTSFFVCLFVYLFFVYLFVYLFVCLFMDSKAHVGGAGLFVCLPVCLLVCLLVYGQ